MSHLAERSIIPSLLETQRSIVAGGLGACFFLFTTPFLAPFC